MTTKDMEALWKKAKEYAKKSPFCFQSDFYAHKGASEKVALMYLEGEDKKQFLSYAHSQYQNYSNYSGD